MPRILDYTGREVARSLTVAEIRGHRGKRPPLTQVTAGTAQESAAAEEAGIDMLVCLSDFVAAVREGSSKLFVTAAIDFSGAVSDDELLATAYEALVAGADAVITARRLKSLERIAEEDIPVMGHLGFIPKKSTIYGGVRAIGKTASEALVLMDQFRRLESAGAFAVECELIPGALMHEINQRTGLATISLGSGPDADVMFLFSSDICGESKRLPRHARAYADLAGMQAQMQAERIRAMKDWRSEVQSGSFPGEAETASIDHEELRRFLDTIDRDDGGSPKSV